MALVCAAGGSDWLTNNDIKVDVPLVLSFFLLFHL
jgi:hypothetical protein